MNGAAYCPACNGGFEIDIRLSGQVIECPHCRLPMQIPFAAPRMMMPEPEPVLAVIAPPPIAEPPSYAAQSYASQSYPVPSYPAENYESQTYAPPSYEPAVPVAAVSGRAGLEKARRFAARANTRRVSSSMTMVLLIVGGLLGSVVGLAVLRRVSPPSFDMLLEKLPILHVIADRLP